MPPGSREPLHSGGLAHLLLVSVVDGRLPQVMLMSGSRNRYANLERPAGRVDGKANSHKAPTSIAGLGNQTLMAPKGSVVVQCFL